MGLRFFVLSAVALITSAIVGILLGAVLSTLHADVQRLNRSLDDQPGLVEPAPAPTGAPGLPERTG